MRNNHDTARHTDRSARIWGIVGTVLFHALLLLCLFFCFLRYPPEGVTQWPPEPQREIVFDRVEDLYASGEFVRTGDTPDETLADEPAPSDADQPLPTQDAPDQSDAGQKGNPSKTVSSDRPSPMKVDKTPKGPTKEEIEAEKARQEAQRRQEAKKTADDATRKAFGGKGKGQAGQADGNSATGAVSGTPGNGVSGRTLEHWDRVSSTKTGEIAIRVKVDSQGKVVSATYDPTRSNGAVAGDTRMRERCRQKSLECRFSVKEGAPTASGTITWRFK
ncbi:MAG: hypothetical protein K2L97_04790 [Muribaculaceae bacterium]|nr:hypothetical protein [Muribaculaceae bacterium]